jgi:outer membrane protein assembly factor BamB
MVDEVNERPDPIWEAHVGAGMTTSPGLADGVILACFADGRLRALDAGDGSVRFTSTPLEATESSRIVSDGTVIFGSTGGVIYVYGVPDMDGRGGER